VATIKIPAGLKHDMIILLHLYKVGCEKYDARTFVYSSSSRRISPEGHRLLLPALR
jgi:hypothetical protein